MWVKLGLGYLGIETELASLGFWSLDIISSVTEMKSYQFLHFKPFRNCILRLKTHHNPMRFVFWNIFSRYHTILIMNSQWHCITVTSPKTGEQCATHRRLHKCCWRILGGLSATIYWWQRRWQRWWQH